MTRKEEIEQAAFEYIDNWYKKHDMVKSVYPVDVAVSEMDFKAGAEWADKNPNKEEFTDKACKWLEPVFQNCAGYNCGMYLLDAFRRAMEE